MDRYARVSFGRDEKEKQRLFLLAMNAAEIIQVSREDIDRWYEEDVKMNTGCNNCIVLHNDEEVNRFIYVMRTFFNGVPYKITSDPDNEVFKECIEKSKKELP